MATLLARRGCDTPPIHPKSYDQRPKTSRPDSPIFVRDDVAEILNLQPAGNKCKPYQVKQVRNVIINYQLAGGVDV